MVNVVYSGSLDVVNLFVFRGVDLEIEDVYGYMLFILVVR